MTKRGDDRRRDLFGDGTPTPVTRPPRLSDKVADSILETIVGGGLRPGDALPTERELGEYYGVSRTVVREAVKALSARGMVSSRAGRGLRVAAVDADDVSASMRLYLHGRDELPYERIHEVREAIEIQIAGVAAARVSEEDLAELEGLCDRLTAAREDAEEHSRLDVEFHRALARATHNELFLIMLDSIGDVMLAIRRRTASLPDDAATADREHRRVLAAVQERDPAAARAAMQRHLDGAAREWQGLGPLELER